MSLTYHTRRLSLAFGVILLIAVALGAVKLISSHLYTRADLTRDRRFTLAEGSRHIVQRLTSPVTLTFYYSQTVKEVPVPIKDYARRVEDLLREYELAGKGKIVVKKIDALPRSDAEDAAQMAGMEQQGAANGMAYFYLGLQVGCVDQNETMGALDLSRESVLEFELSRAIQRVANPQRPALGLMAGLPVLGPGDANPFMKQEQRRPWVFAQELKKDYDVREVATTVSEIPADLGLLLVLHPKNLAPVTLYAIDQFVLRGGKLLAFVDPLSMVDAQSSPMAQYMGPQPSSSTLGPLFDAWGVGFSTKDIVADLAYGFQTPQGTQPAYLALDKRCMNEKEPMTSALTSLQVPLAGAFTGEAAPGLTKTVLVHTSDKARLLDGFKMQMGMDINEEFNKQDGKTYALAIKLAGTFKTAYPQGPPPPTPADPKKPDQPPPPPPPTGTPLKESAQPGAVILFADADLLHDTVWLARARNPFTGEIVHQIRNDNNSFLQNALDQLAGGADLITVRSRAVNEPPFTVVIDLRKKAEETLRGELAKVVEDINATRDKLGKMRDPKKGKQQWIETPAERAEVETLQKKIKDLEKTRADLDKKLRRDIDRLGAHLMWANVVAMPLLVVFFGCGVWVFRRLR